MKYTFSTKKSLFIGLCAFALLATSCIKDDMPLCSYTLKLKVENAKGDDITAATDVAATLYIFNTDNEYLGKKEMTNAQVNAYQNIVLSEYPNVQNLRIIAWCGTEGQKETVASLSEKDLIEKLQVLLKSSNNIATAPDNLYFGSDDVVNNEALELSKQAGDQVIVAKPKIGHIHITTIGLLSSKYFKSATKANSDTNLEYYVRRTQSGFDYTGSMIGDQVSYNPPASFTNTTTDGTTNILKAGTDEFVAETSNLLPSNSIAVDLYNNSNQLFSVNKDDNGTAFTTHEDSTLYVIIRFVEGQGVLSVKAQVRPWGEVVDPHTF